MGLALRLRLPREAEATGSVQWTWTLCTKSEPPLVVQTDRELVGSEDGHPTNHTEVILGDRRRHVVERDRLQSEPVDELDNTTGGVVS